MLQRSPERRTVRRTLTRYRPHALVAISAFVLGGIAAHLEARWPHWSMDFGDVPTWVAAIAAIGAGWFAARAFGLQQTQLAEMRKAQEESGLLLKYQAHEAARAFARQVGCNWMIQKLAAPAVGDEIAGYVVATLRNESEGSVSNVAFRLLLSGHVLPPDGATWDVRWPDDGRWTPVPANIGLPSEAETPVETVPPNNGLTARWNMGRLPQPSEAKVEIRFTDEPGTRWHVASDGKLSVASDDRW